MLGIELGSSPEECLALLANKTGRSEEFFAREAIAQYLEDYYLALEASKTPGRIYTSAEAKRELGL